MEPFKRENELKMIGFRKDTHYLSNCQSYHPVGLAWDGRQRKNLALEGNMGTLNLPFNIPSGIIYGEVPKPTEEHSLVKSHC